jgi:hypothetical protein
LDSTPITEPATPSANSDPIIERIVEALEQIRSEEFDYEILTAASEVMGEDMLKSWRPSLSYLTPEKQGDEYHVTIYAQGACESCPVKRSHLDSLEPKLRALTGLDNLIVHDYFDMWDTQRQPMWGDG